MNNRAQRRAQSKAERMNRAARIGRSGIDRYVNRARRKLSGMSFLGIPVGDELHGQWSFSAMMLPGDQKQLIDYAEEAPHQWHIRVTVRFAAGDNAYLEEVEADIGQTVMLGELVDEWQRLLRKARDRGNPNHFDSEMVEIMPSDVV